MLALTRIGRKYGRRGRRGATALARDRAFVLPRPLRRPVRFFQALIDERITIPRHLGSYAATGLIGLTLVYGVTVGGHLETMLRASTSSMGFAVDDINVSGNVETSPIDVFQQIGLDGDNSSLITLDVEEARALVKQLPWVADAEVRKVYPGAIEIVISERQAFGIWQHGKDLSLIEKNGSVIAPMAEGKFVELPLFVGFGADQNAVEIDALLAGWPEVKARIKAYIRVADRRWDLRLDNGVTVLLPETRPAEALNVLVAMEQEHDLLERDIKSVDLRLADRVVVGLTDGAAERRLEALDERAKILKKRSSQT